LIHLNSSLSLVSSVALSLIRTIDLPAVRQLVEQVDHLGQQRRGRDGEARVPHVVRVGRVVAAEGAQEGEDVLADDGEHLRRGEVLEARPAEVLMVAPAGVRAGREDAARHRPLRRHRLALLQRLEVVEAAQEEQVGELLHHLQRVGDAARPERIPQPPDPRLQVIGQHPTRCTPEPPRRQASTGDRDVATLKTRTSLARRRFAMA